MIPKRPYLLRAFNEWIVENNMTPYILVNALVKEVNVPKQHIKDGKIVLNISPMAVHDFILDNDALSFSARFNQVSFYIYCPMASIEAIYAREEPAEGISFSPDEYPDVELISDESEQQRDRPVLTSISAEADDVDVDSGDSDQPDSGDSDQPDSEDDEVSSDEPPPKKRPSLRVVK